MCGIFGYVGSRQDAGKLVVEGLKNLEYRGYDSWGVAWKRGREFGVEKDTGKISAIDSDKFSDNCGLAVAHTRWATHGGVTKCNAHPHLSGDGSIAVVHNGIVENYQELRDELKVRGHTFLSETDTEVVPHLIEEELKCTEDFAAAFRAVCKRLHGRYALLALNTKSNILVAARTGSPLIVGVGKGKDRGYYIASDIPAFMDATRTVQYLDDGEMVVSDGRSIMFTDIETGMERPKREVEITWIPEQAQKGEYEHFMMKEIMDQKESIARAVNQDETQIRTIAEAIRNARGTFLVGCGTA
ncbi:glutamine--fructose-6-phosphate transaminase (isomerizing), partial [Candidatus Peregrinibacteria bacterium]|nr:glutamine--fructose-6-phosphate transaminase (isomerizing) [Candidatus Peregrinibacteria bacterium]